MPTPLLEPHERPQVVLHAGMGKTGTTTIQAFLHRNRQRLLDRGVLFPESPGRRRHVRLGLAAQSDDAPRSVDWQFQDLSSPGELRPVVEQELRDEVRRSGARTLLLSDEALSGASLQAMEILRVMLEDLASSVRLVLYLRRQDDHLCSRYQQVVRRNGSVQTLAERADRAQGATLYDYRARLDAWRSLLRPDDLVVRRFERQSFAGGSLHVDFLDAAGLDVPPEDLEEPPVRNESLDAESVEMLRLLNILRRQHGGEEIPGMPRRRRLMRRLDEASSGPTLTLPADRLDRFMAPWVASNQAVAREFFPAGPEALFANPRKTRNTTTEQFLEPSRIDHFVDQLELPATAREPLRLIAEREAARG